jgi:hypothetical protein
MASAAVQVNWYERDEAVDTVGEAIVSTLLVSAGTTVAVELRIAAAAILVFSAKVTAAVRPARFAACALLGVVSPVATVVVHVVFSVTGAYLAVNTTEAAVVPWPVSWALQRVAPQSVCLGFDTTRAPLVPVKSGSTTVTASSMASTAVVWNSYETEDAVAVTGIAIVSTLLVSAGLRVAGDVPIAVAAIVTPALASVAAAVRVARLAIWIGAAGAESPDPTVK